MLTSIKNFINKYERLIDDNEWDTLYELAMKELDASTGHLTDMLSEVGINPLEYLDYVPVAMFANSDRVKIDIPESIHTICESAFMDCKAIKIKLPTTLIELGEASLSGCHFNAIDLPRSLTYIGNNAFELCTELESIDLPPNITIIPTECFDSCYDLKKVSLPDNLEKILNNAFRRCNNLHELFIPDSVNFIHSSAIPKHVRIICRKDSYAYNFAREKLYTYSVI